MKLRELSQTSIACPSQWEGELEDGRYVYVRYRHGCLDAAAAPTIDEAILWNDETEVILYDENVGDSFDGFMTTEEMLERTGLEYDG